MYKIAKQFDFCYGHRVWSQSLNAEFSVDNCLKCRHLHGHQGTINIFLEAEELREGMVTDFKHLNWFKVWLDDYLDHKFIMDLNDPVLSNLYDWLFDAIFTPNENTRFELNMNRLVPHKEGCWTVHPDVYQNFAPAMIEIVEGLIFVDFVPTSENLSKWIFDIVQEKMKPLGVKVAQVQFYETPKSQSNYFNNL